MTESDQWRHSTRCGMSACVEVLLSYGQQVYVRDSAARVLAFDATVWQAFIDDLKANEHALEVAYATIRVEQAIARMVPHRLGPINPC